MSHFFKALTGCRDLPEPGLELPEARWGAEPSARLMVLSTVATEYDSAAGSRAVNCGSLSSRVTSFKQTSAQKCSISCAEPSLKLKSLQLLYPLLRHFNSYYRFALLRNVSKSQVEILHVILTVKITQVQKKKKQQKLFFFFFNSSCF